MPLTKVRGAGIGQVTTALDLKRSSSNGDVIELSKDSTAVGNIGVVTTSGGVRPYISAEGSHGVYLDSAGNNFNTATASGSDNDNAIDLGASFARWKNLYLSGGAYIGGTGSANYLDDYEEGTWTPSLNSNANSNGIYTKIGRMVTLNAYVGSTDSSTSSAVIVTGLPFAVADLLSNTSHEAQGTISYHENAGGNYASAVVVRTGNEIDFLRSNTLTQLQYSDNSSTWSIRFSVTYFTS